MRKWQVKKIGNEEEKQRNREEEGTMSYKTRWVRIDGVLEETLNERIGDRSDGVKYMDQ